MSDQRAFPSRPALILAALVGLLLVPWSVPWFLDVVVRPLQERLDDRQLTVFAQQIAAADRVVARDGWGAISTNEFRIILTGAEAKRVVHAVSSAKADRTRYKNMYLTHPTFFAGTNLVGEIRMDEGHLFLAGDIQYRDVTCDHESHTCDGTLSRLITAPLARMAQEAALRTLR